MPAEPIGPHMTATPVDDEWLIHDNRGFRLGTVEWRALRCCYGFKLHLPLAHDADSLRAIADFLDRVTAARKARGGGA